MAPWITGAMDVRPSSLSSRKRQVRRRGARTGRPAGASPQCEGLRGEPGTRCLASGVACCPSVPCESSWCLVSICLQVCMFTEKKKKKVLGCHPSDPIFGHCLRELPHTHFIILWDEMVSLLPAAVMCCCPEAPESFCISSSSQWYSSKNQHNPSTAVSAPGHGHCSHTARAAVSVGTGW